MRINAHAVAAVILIAAAPSPLLAQTPAFPHGVASGDVTHGSAVLWTRTATAETLRLELATDPAFATLALTRDAQTGPDTDFTLHVDTSGLQPATRYWYRFLRSDGAISPVGQFRTAPPPDAQAPLRFVFTGDSNAAHRPFRVLEAARQESPDFWFWFGDTVYADGVADGLPPATTLAQYRVKW